MTLQGVNMNNWLSFFPIIIILVLMAAAAGWFVKGFYSNNADYIAVKFRTYDLVLLTFITPLSVVMFFLARADQTWPKLFVLGILIYLAFSYGFNVFNCYQNQLFLVYVAIFSLCVFATIMGLVDMANTIKIISNLTLIKAISIVLLLIAVSGAQFWLMEAIIALVKKDVSPSIVGLNLPINAAQVLDIGFMLPLTIFGAIKLLQSQPIGMLISAMMLVFFVLISVSVIAMEIGLKLNGFEMEPGKLYGFGSVIVLSLVMTFLTYLSLAKL
jgi:hypothetical protein